MSLLVRLEKKFGKFSHSRDQLPPELAEKGVPHSVWSDTVDGFVGWYEWKASNGGSHIAAYTQGSGCSSLAVVGLVFLVFGVILGPLFLVIGATLLIAGCIVGGSNQPAVTGVVDTFDYFFNKQEENYSIYGIRVKRGGPRSFPKLLFCEDDETPKEGYQHPTQDSLTQDLQSLHNLHQSGALTEDEYARSKERVIQKSTDVTKTEESTRILVRGNMPVANETQSEGLGGKILYETV